MDVLGTDWRSRPVMSPHCQLLGEELTMKLLCPRCGAGNRIGWQTRYQSFSCSSCNLLFFGLEAETSLGSFILDDPAKTPCPFCWRYIYLMHDGNGGWYGPEVCQSCLRELPPKPVYS
jgi:hypothetical protein